MTKTNPIIIVIVVVVGIWLLSNLQFGELSLVSLEDSPEGGVPRGVGYGNIRDTDDGLLDGKYPCETLYGTTTGDAPNCINQICATQKGIFEPKTSAVIDSLIPDVAVLNPEFEEIPFFFESDAKQEITIKLDAQGLDAYVDSLGSSQESPYTLYMWAWLESEVVGFEREEAIRLYGKPVSFSDLSRTISLSGGESQNITFVIGTLDAPLPIGEYDFYAIVTLEHGTFSSTFGSGCGDTTAHPPKYQPLTPYIHANVLVNPAPLTIATFEGQSCGEGYVFQNPSEEVSGVCSPQDGAQTCACVREDVSDLACVRIGCPITIDPNTGELIPYTCQSDGFCSETIFRSNMCETNDDCGPNEICDNTILEHGTGTCFNEGIIDELIGFCLADSDCWDPQCSDSNGDAVAVQCVSGECSYSGQCDVQLDDCTNLGCPDGFNCVEETTECVRVDSEGDTTSAPPGEEKDGFFGFGSTGITVSVALLIIAILIGAVIIFDKK